MQSTPKKASEIGDEHLAPGKVIPEKEAKRTVPRTEKSSKYHSGSLSVAISRIIAAPCPYPRKCHESFYSLRVRVHEYQAGG